MNAKLPEEKKEKVEKGDGKISAKLGGLRKYLMGSSHKNKIVKEGKSSKQGGLNNCLPPCQGEKTNANRGLRGDHRHYRGHKEGPGNRSGRSY